MFFISYESCFPCFFLLLFYFTPHFTTAHSFTVLSSWFLQKHFSGIHNLSACSVILQSISVHYIICVWHEETRTRTRTRNANSYISFPKSPYGIHIHGQFAVSVAACAHFFTFPRQQQTLPFSIFLLFFYPEFSDDKTTKNADSTEPKTETESDQKKQENK